MKGLLVHVRISPKIKNLSEFRLPIDSCSKNIFYNREKFYYAPNNDRCDFFKILKYCTICIMHNIHIIKDIAFFFDILIYVINYTKFKR